MKAKSLISQAIEFRAAPYISRMLFSKNPDREIQDIVMELINNLKKKGFNRLRGSVNNLDILIKEEEEIWKEICKRCSPGRYDPNGLRIILRSEL